MYEILNNIKEWANENPGFTPIILFIVTLILGWASGIFKALRRNPKFKIEVIPGPSLCSTFETGDKYQGMPVHVTAVSLYLKISNVGSESSQIDQVQVGYKNYDPRYMFRCYWLKQTVIKRDFGEPIGKFVRIFPFLIQRSHIIPEKSETFLPIGGQANGMVYFEQNKSYGGFQPRKKNEKIRIIVRVRDVFGRNHSKSFRIPCVSIEEARKYNEYFGKTGDDTE